MDMNFIGITRFISSLSFILTSFLFKPFKSTNRLGTSAHWVAKLVGGKCPFCIWGFFRCNHYPIWKKLAMWSYRWDQEGYCLYMYVWNIEVVGETLFWFVWKHCLWTFQLDILCSDIGMFRNIVAINPRYFFGNSMLFNCFMVITCFVEISCL